jgi:hypothetical protein
MVASSPLMLGLARADTAIEIARQHLEMGEQRTDGLDALLLLVIIQQM